MSTPVTALNRATSRLRGLLAGPVGIGVDLVEVADVEALVRTGDPSFLVEAWSANELGECEGAPESLAARWAAKEAVMKALGCGLGDLAPSDIEIRTDARSGAPSVVLHRKALLRAEETGVVSWAVSLCHENGWAAAIAVARTSEHVASRPTDGRPAR